MRGGHGHRPEDERVEQREGDRIGGDAEGEREDRRHAEGGALRQRSNRVADVRQQRPCFRGYNAAMINVASSS